MKGWFLKITDLQELLEDLKTLKLARKSKIDAKKLDRKSFGALIDFHILETNDKLLFFQQDQTLYLVIIYCHIS